MSDYYAFGKTLRTFNTSKYQFTGKEHDKENNLEYFGARKYDADIARWTSIDPMREKYPSLTPYNYAANNPVFFIDPDGRDIIPYHIMAIENRIGAMGKVGELSSATESAIKDVMKTENGLKFLSQFAKKGQTFAGHTFTEDGALSMHDLIIADWSLEKMDELFPTTLDGKFGVEYNKDGNKLTFKMELYTQAQSKYERGETYIHESTLHDLAQKYATAFKEGGAEGFQKTYDQEQLSNPEGEKEHQALKNRDFSNAGYRRYSDLMMQLFKVNPFYVYPYNTAHDDAQKKY
jgi:RHS repeat-associated protein